MRVISLRFEYQNRKVATNRDLVIWGADNAVSSTSAAPFPRTALVCRVVQYEEVIGNDYAEMVKTISRLADAGVAVQVDERSRRRAGRLRGANLTTRRLRAN